MKRVNIFRGMGVALVTPFDEQGAVDFAALEKLLRLHLEAGTDFLCILGTTAETPCLSAAECEQIRQTAVSIVGGKLPLLLGCGGNNTAAVTATLRDMDLTGYDGVLIVTPYYNKPTQEGLFQHYTAVAAASPLPVVLYNVPGRTGVNLTAQTTLRIARHCPNVVAIKEASGKLEQIQEIAKCAPEGFDVISGDDALTCDILQMGGVGVISVIGNAFPKEFGQMVRTAMRGETDKALSMHRRFQPLYPLMTADGNPAGIKSLLTLQGRIHGGLRLPLVPASKETENAIGEFLRTFPQ